MATLTLSETKTEKHVPSPPPQLMSGDHLTRSEFERIYKLNPDIKKAELIEGVVYVASPVYLPHADIHSRIMTWAGTYVAYDQNLKSADNLSVRLDLDNEVQPDVCIWTKDGKATSPDNTYLEGAPDLVIEVAVSSASYDLHNKLDVYKRSGVKEYIVLIVKEQRTVWYELKDAAYVEIEPTKEAVFKSNLFKGLWLDSAAFWKDDLKQVLSVLNEGIGT